MVTEIKKTDVGERRGKDGIWLDIAWENFLGLWKYSISCFSQ